MAAVPAWAQAQPTLVACLDETDRSAYAYPEPSGQWRGATVDLVVELGRQAGYPVQVQPLPWSRCLNRAKSNLPDAATLALYASANPQRLSDYAFLGPVHHVEGGVWFSRDRADLPHAPASFDVLSRYRLCGFSGHNYAWLKEVGLQRIDAGVHSLRAAVVMLKLGRCDYLLGSRELRSSAQHSDVAATEMESLDFAPYPGGRRVGQFLLVNKALPRHREIYDSLASAFVELNRRGVVERIYKEYGLSP